jgi:hypothetical protein
MLQVANKEDRRHATPTELALDLVAASQTLLDARPDIGHLRFENFERGRRE